MGLTKRECRILELSNQGLSDYKIGRHLKISPTLVGRAHKNAQKKLANALKDIEGATKLGLDISEFDADIEETL